MLFRYALVQSKLFQYLFDSTITGSGTAVDVVVDRTGFGVCCCCCSVLLRRGILIRRRIRPVLLRRGIRTTAAVFDGTITAGSGTGFSVTIVSTLLLFLFLFFFFRPPPTSFPVVRTIPLFMYPPIVPVPVVSAVVTPFLK